MITDSFADAEDHISEPDDNVVLLVETTTASEIQDLTSPVAKKRPPTPANEPVFSGALKRFRTLSSYTADRLLDCLTPGNQMGDDALQVLCEVVMAHHRQKHRPARLFHPFWFQSQEDFQPRSFPRLDDGCTAGFPIHCPKPWEPVEHWAFGVMTPKGENMELRIHDSTPTPERYERIKKRFEAWMDVSSYSGDVEFIKEVVSSRQFAWLQLTLARAVPVKKILGVAVCMPWPAFAVFFRAFRVVRTPRWIFPPSKHIICHYSVPSTHAYSLPMLARLSRLFEVSNEKPICDALAPMKFSDSVMSRAVVYRRQRWRR